MSTVTLAREGPEDRRWYRVAAIAAALALVSAAIYFAISLGLTPESLESPPAPIMFIAGLAYLAGAALILRRDQRLLTAGAIANALVIIAFFVSLALGRSDLEIVSVLSKLSQAVLEGLLLWLRRYARR